MAKIVITENIEGKVLRAYARLESTQKVAKQIGLGASTVHRILKRHGVECGGLEVYRRSIKKLPSSEQLRSEYESGMHLSEIAKKYGVSNGTVYEAMKKTGVTMRRRGRQRRVFTGQDKSGIADLYASGWTQTAIANEVGTHQTNVSRILRAAGIFDGRRPAGHKHGSWKGGRINAGKGYIGVAVARDDALFKMADSQGYVLEHRLVMARELGRPLMSHETVHHINGDRKDNRLSNLQLMFGKHGAGVAMVCAKCGSHDIICTELHEG